jgi:hypothetical protein
MTPSLYARLHREILERDGWRCQMCGCAKRLDVHHLRRRSALGDDIETNLITLCRDATNFSTWRLMVVRRLKLAAVNRACIAVITRADNPESYR